jgi:hypothetical protein
LDRRHLRPQPRDDRPGTLGRVRAHLVGLEPDDEEGLVGRRDVIDEIEPDDRQHTLDARDRPGNVLDLLDDGFGAVERNTFG